MTQALDRLREPAALAALVLMAVTVLLALLGMVVPSMARFPVLPASGGVGAGAVLFAAVAWCVSGQTTNSRILALSGAAVLAGAVVVDLLQIVMISADEPNLSLNYALEWVVEMVFTAAMVVGLVVVGMADQRSQPAQPPQPGQPPQPTVPVGPPQPGPVWQPDQAAARSWTRAGDAATGAAATQWGQPSSPSWGGGAPPWGTNPTNPSSPSANSWSRDGDGPPRAD